MVVPKSGLIPALSRNGNNAEAFEPGRVHLKTNILEVRTSSLLDTQSASRLLPRGGYPMKKFKILLLLGSIVLALGLMSSCSNSSTQVVATGQATTTDSSQPMESMNEGDAAEQITSAFPVTLQTPTGDLVLEDQPIRILSLSPTATEILFAIGAGDQVIAVDDQSNYPPEAPTSDISGFTPNLEAILALEPDLVVHSYLPEDIEQGLSNVGIPSLTQYAATSLDDTYLQITQLGTATGASAGAESTVQEMQQKIDELMDSVDVPDGSSLTFYHELDPTYFSVTSSTFIGQVYALFGLTNIADEAEGAGSGYPQLSEEYILSQNPDLIFLADTKCCAQNIETVTERNGWNVLSAVIEGKVIELDDDIASRWGPRVVDFLEAIASAVEQMTAVETIG